MRSKDDPQDSLLHADDEIEIEESPSERRWRLQQPPAWKVQLASIEGARLAQNPALPPWPRKRQIVYQIDAAPSNVAHNLVLSVGVRDQRQDGSFGRISDLKLQRGAIRQLPVAEDRTLLAALAGAAQHLAFHIQHGLDPIPHSFVMNSTLALQLVPAIVSSGRCCLKPERSPDRAAEGPTVLQWDDGEAWRFSLSMKRAKNRRWVVAGSFERGSERLELSKAVVITENFLVAQGKVARVTGELPFEWVTYLRHSRNIEAPDDDGDELLEQLLRNVPVDVRVPPELHYESVSGSPRPHLRLHGDGGEITSSGRVEARLSFLYEGRKIPADDFSAGVFDPSARRVYRRDRDAEAAAMGLLTQLGFQPAHAHAETSAWSLPAAKLLRALRSLVEAGWHIDADGKVFRQPGAFRMNIASHVDWFELRGEVQYGDTHAQLPELIEALRRGHSAVRLEDGTYGVLSEEWLQQLGLLASMGVAENGHIRFQANQAGVLDALLLARPEATYDQAFSRAREQLRNFDAIEPAAQPAGFVGELRGYQREGLSWMEFLRRSGFGGCLADDMGVGKTAQVLALLEARRAQRDPAAPHKPSLVVVPKSLVFNWRQEAARFTPQLRLLDYTGLGRSLDDLSSVDLAITTYGTLRRDILRLKDVEFDYVVLDEAQIVKNANTDSAKTVRLLKAQHRLALSGTPVENHVGELFALIDFLNPGMLGASGMFKLVSDAVRRADREALQLLARAVKPFILRRTKEQVARELPAKTEQTIYCELEPDQRKLYDELRQHYRLSLLHRIESEGFGKSKIHVLEALLRLRQAACHPGLIDPARAGENSAKTDDLLTRLREIREEGHKALVFSQFTSFLKIVRERLDAEHLTYEYLDGATRHRDQHVERFQNDPECGLFLISLKAGGLGLNLTAAEYVFLLDPWWNPAVEAQAVDRAHRIGQTRQVFAYRLIARDTVEEKVLELQRTKKDLADAIINADNSLMRDLKPEDLELLLS